MEPTVITQLKNAATSSELKAAVDALPRSHVFFSITQIRDLILQKQHLVVDAPSADAVVSYLRFMSTGHSTCNLLHTAEIRDLIIDALAPKISAGDSVKNLGMTIFKIVPPLNDVVQLYSNRRSFSAILDCFYRATTTESARWIAGSIYRICSANPFANTFLNNLPVVEAYSAIIPHATTSDAVYRILDSINEILKNNKPAQKLFGTLAFLEKFRTMEKHATSDDAKFSFKRVVDILHSNFEAQFLTVAYLANEIAENDELTSQLREQLERSQNALKEKNDRLEIATRALADKEAQLQQERTEHEKTRNLLQRIRTESNEKESGQRREREDEEAFQVKMNQELNNNN